MNKWQDLYDKSIGCVITIADFTVTLYSFIEGGLRYSEGDRSITFILDIVDDREQSGWRWRIFQKVKAIVYVPALLRWDDGAPVGSAMTPIVINRIMEAIAVAGESATIEISDEVYAQAEEDFRKFGPKRAGQRGETP